MFEATGINHCYGEVDHCDLRAQLWREVRVAKPRCHVHAKCVRIFALLVRQHNFKPTARLLHKLVEHRIEDRVQHLLNVLKQERLTE